MLCNYYLILCYISCQHHIKTHRRGLKAIVNPYANKHPYTNKKKRGCTDTSSKLLYLWCYLSPSLHVPPLNPATVVHILKCRSELEVGVDILLAEKETVDVCSDMLVVSLWQLAVTMTSTD